MKAFKLTGLFIFLAFAAMADMPDTTRIPDKWKNESIVILKQWYKVSEASNNEYDEEIYCSYYIKDKFGLRKLSTLSISNEIKTDVERTIGKIYKKDGSVVYITTKHLTENKVKIGKGNRRNGSGTAVDYETNQKLAIPSLAVGDILEIEYSSKRKALPAIIALSPRYPAMKMEISASVRNIDAYYGYYNPYVSELYHKLVNIEDVSMSATARDLHILRDTVDKVKEEILADENKLYPYIILAKTYKSISGSDDLKTNFSDFSNEKLEAKQLSIVRGIYHRKDREQKRVAADLTQKLKVKHAKSHDTLAFLKDLFFYYRENMALGSILNNDDNDYSYKGDLFFADVVSRVLFANKIPHYIFITQPDYFGEPVSENEIVKPHYGIHIPGKNYYLFNPFVCSLPNQIPSYYEEQSYVKFKANKYYKPYHFNDVKILSYPLFVPVTFPIVLPVYLVKAHNAKKHRSFGFKQEKFPVSDADENLTYSNITINEFNTRDQTCNFNMKSGYLGKNKTRFSKNICTNTLLYENTKSDYKPLYSNLKPEENTQQLQDKYLKKFLLSDLENDGYDVVKLKEYKVDETNFFEPTKPIVTNCTFEAKNVIFAYDKYIIVNVGSLLGNQLSNNSRDTVRSNDFFIPYKKMYSYKINIEIPSGYAADDLSSLNQKISTPAGSFVATAKLKGNVIEVSTDKVYNFRKYSKTQAKEVLEFIKVANEYSQKKLLLRKV